MTFAPASEMSAEVHELAQTLTALAPHRHLTLVTASALGLAVTVGDDYVKGLAWAKAQRAHIVANPNTDMPEHDTFLLGFLDLVIAGAKYRMECKSEEAGKDLAVLSIDLNALKN